MISGYNDVAWNRIRCSRASFEVVQSWVYWYFHCIGLDCLKPLCDLPRLWKGKFLLFYFLLNHHLCLHLASSLCFQILGSVTWHAPESMPMETWFTAPKSLSWFTERWCVHQKEVVQNQADWLLCLPVFPTMGSSVVLVRTNKMGLNCHPE